MDVIQETSRVAWACIEAHENNVLIMPEVELTDLSLYNPRAWTLLSAFFSSRPWFHRAWTIQIVRKGQLVCDKFGIDLRSQYFATEYWLSTRTPEDVVHMSFLQVLEATS
jgi:hypothetical protein